MPCEQHDVLLIVLSLETLVVKSRKKIRELEKARGFLEKIEVKFPWILNFFCRFRSHLFTATTTFFPVLLSYRDKSPEEKLVSLARDARGR